MIHKNSLPRLLLFVAMLIFLSFSATACNVYINDDGGSLAVLHEKTFETSPGKKLTLKAYSGDVIITTSKDPKVYVKVMGNEKAEKHLEFKFNSDEDGVEITAERKGGWSLFNFGSGIRLRFELIIPDKYNASVSSSGGDIQLKDLTGDVQLKSSGGDVAVQNTSGELKVSTSGGDISLNNNSGDITLKTSGGDIQTRSFSGNIYASSSGGDVTLQGSNGTVEASSSGGEVTLDYTGENKGIKLSSSGGDIKLRLPADFNAHAELYTSGGDIDCAFRGNNAEKISSSKYEADFNDGGNTVYAKTSGGDIVVKKR